jgi:hypothetical protein
MSGVGRTLAAMSYHWLPSARGRSLPTPTPAVNGAQPDRFLEGSGSLGVRAVRGVRIMLRLIDSLRLFDSKILLSLKACWWDDEQGDVVRARRTEDSAG